MEFEGYLNVASDEFKALEAKLHPNLDNDLELFKGDIKSMIESEIVQRYYYKKGGYFSTSFQEIRCSKSCGGAEGPGYVPVGA